MSTTSATDMAAIEAHAKLFADARDALQERLQELRDEQEQVRRRRMKGVKNAIALFTASHDELLAAVRDRPELFQKPKSRVLHAIKVGWVKQRDALTIVDPDRTIALIEQLMPDKAKLLVNVTKKPIAAAIAELDADELAAIEVATREGDESPFVKPIDDEVTKLVKALLKSDDDDTTRAEEMVR